METSQAFWHVEQRPGVLTFIQEKRQRFCHDVSWLWLVVRHCRMGEYIWPYWGYQHVLSPGCLQQRLLYSLNIYIETPLFKGTREGVRRQRLKPRKKRQITVIKFTLTQNVCKLNWVWIFRCCCLLLTIVNTAFIKDSFDDELEQSVVWRDKWGWNRFFLLSCKKILYQR